MQSGSTISSEDEAIGRDCTFCQRQSIAKYILKETDTFRIVADHAPLVEGHMLIIPRQHYACYGTVPAEHDAELFALKDEVRRFFTRFYSAPIFWEHGVFRQSVFHAHLHCFPFGKTAYDVSETRHDLVVQSQNDIRVWFATRGHYFYMEDLQHAFLFSPDMEDYMHIIQTVLRAVIITQGQHKDWRPTQQRQLEGKPLIESVIARWQAFQKQQMVQVDSSRSH